MKKKLILSFVALAFSLLSFAQDYKVTSVDYLQKDFTARKTILTEKLDGGKQCAVLRIATQNITEKDRDAFMFECDLGSVIRERRNDGGEICLWVSPGIKILKIKHKILGNYVLNISEFLHGNVQSLNTYQINIVGLKELVQEPLSFGSSQIVFRPSPENAILYLNGDSIGVGEQTVRSIAGTYEWSYIHDLYENKSGIVQLKKGSYDTIDVVLRPSYGYLKICDDYGFNEEIKVYLNGNQVGAIPYESGRLASGKYEVMLQRQNIQLASNVIEIKEREITIDSIRDFITGARRCHYNPVTATLTLNSVPEAAIVTIDGTYQGVTPLSLDNLIIGSHDIKLTKSGYSPHKQEILLLEKQELNLNVSLQQACIITISSDASGDKVFVDDAYVGETPMTLNVSFGNHTFAIERNGFKLEEKQLLMPSDKEKTIRFSFGQKVKVETDNDKDKIYLDGALVGHSPVDVYLANGRHLLKASHGWKTGEQTVNIEGNKPLDKVFINTHTQSPSAFLENGVFFITGNVAMLTKENPVYGLSFGDMNNAGWFISLMTNMNFEPFRSQTFADASGCVNGILPLYTGETTISRASATIGAILKLGGPVFMRIGAGGGVRQYAWKAANSNDWVVISDNSWKNFEMSMGLQLCIYNFVINADVLAPLDLLTERKKLFEFRAGIGFCLRHKQ